MSILFSALFFKFRRRQIADRGMQPPTVVDFIQKPPDPAPGIGEVFVLVEINLVILERFHKALTLGIVVRVSLPAHADPNVMLIEHPRVIVRRVLHAAIRMMNQPWRPRCASDDRHLQGCQSQFGIDLARQLLTDDPLGKGVKNHRQVNELLKQTDVGNVRNPELIEPGRREIAGQIWIDSIAVIGIGRDNKSAMLAQAQQIIFAHHPQDSFVIDRRCFVTSVEFGGDRPITIGRPFESDPLNVIANDHLFGIRLENFLALPVIGRARNLERRTRMLDRARFLRLRLT